ncbi:MAG TPA: DUF1570 domain-containing protein [Kiritimatiellia bacterium]|nr:DUF1570 domain-containing protein [Kiritimatiellia bacterium]
MRMIPCVLVVGLCCTAAVSAAPPRVAFRTAVEIPEEGLTLRLPSGAEVVGLDPPRIYTYRNPAGDLFERFDARELWIAAQFKRQWRDPAGHVFLVATPFAPYPRDLMDAHVERGTFETRMREIAAPPADPEAFGAWAEGYAGAKLAAPPRMITTPSARLRQILAFTFAGEPARNAYGIRFRPNVFGVDPDQWFFILVQWAGAVDAAEAGPLLEREFLPQIGLAAKREASGGAAATKFQHAATAAAAQTNRSDALAASRAAVINSIRGRRGWWFVETPNYVIASDLPGAQAGAVKRIQADVEFLRGAFARLIPPRRPITAVSVIRAFGSGEAYVAHVGADMAWSGGAWMPSKRELVIRPLEGGTARDRRDWLLNTVYHEAFHQYLAYALDFQETSAWFNEGHATLFEGADIRDGKLELDEVERYAADVTAIAKRAPERVWDIFGLSYEGFYAGGRHDDGARKDNYALAWGLTYFLRKGVPSGGGPAEYAAIPTRYLDALMETRDPAQATAAALQGVDRAAFAAAFREFWNSPSRRSVARRYAP